MNEIKTRYGTFIPYSGEAELRKKNKEPVTYHENGEIASIYFEEIRKVNTPLGEIDAEYLTFYPDGTLKRLFPSYGQISGYWTEEDEYSIAPEAEIALCGRTFRVHPLCIAFYPSGKVKSFTIWNRDTVTVDTKYGEVETNFGFDLREDGKLKSIEPVFGTKLETEKGVIYPFDTDNYRLSAENNSLVFDEEGDIVSVKTLRTGLKVSTGTGIINIRACKAQDPLTGFERLFPLNINIIGELVEVTCLDKIKESFPVDKVQFI